MKRNKVLLGLYVGLLTLAGGVANAQTGGFYEIGPDNIGGEVSSIVVDRLDTSRNTLYAGATTGGLFFRSESVDILRNFYITLGVGDSAADVLSANTDIWHRVPYKVSGKEVSLPISCMAQAPSGELFIGTGSDDYTYGTTYAPMSRKGSGLYRYIPSTGQFVLIPSTTTNDFSVINCIETFQDGTTLYLYVGTSKGLYRWVMFDGSDNWSATPTNVFAGRVDNIVISRPNHTAFFTSGNQLIQPSTNLSVGHFETSVNHRRSDVTTGLRLVGNEAEHTCHQSVALSALLLGTDLRSSVALVKLCEFLGCELNQDVGVCGTINDGVVNVAFSNLGVSHGIHLI